MMFGLVVLAFGLFERIVTGLFKHEALAAIVQNLEEVGIFELLARMLMMMIAFVPLFAFWELGRVIGPLRLKSLFLASPKQANP